MQTQNIQSQGPNLPDMEDTDIAHLAGFIDATGSITAHVSKNDEYSIGYQVHGLIRIVRPADNEDPIIGKFMEYCEEEGVQIGVSDTSNGPQRERDSTELFIKRPEAISRFLEPMLPYLTTEYPKAIVMLEQVVPRIEDEVHHTKEGFYELMEFVDMLRQNTSGDLKYTQEYFEEEWSVVQ